MPNVAPAVVDVDPHDRGVPPTMAPVLVNETATPPTRFPAESVAVTAGAGDIATPAVVAEGACEKTNCDAAPGPVGEKLLLSFVTAPTVNVVDAVRW